MFRLKFKELLKNVEGILSANYYKLGMKNKISCVKL